MGYDSRCLDLGTRLGDEYSGDRATIAAHGAAAMIIITSVRMGYVIGKNGELLAFASPDDEPYNIYSPRRPPAASRLTGRWHGTARGLRYTVTWSPFTNMPRHLRRMKKSRAAVLSLLLARLLLLVARPCSESDVYPGYPLPKQLSIDAVRPYPQLVGCTELDLANVELSSAEAVLLARCIAFAENGEFRNISVLNGIFAVNLDGVSVGDGGAAVIAAAVAPTGPLPIKVDVAMAAAKISSVGAAALASALSAAHSTLSELRLDWNGEIGDAGARSIGSALRGNKVLGVLGLERCGIGDEGAAGLSGPLATAPTVAQHAADLASGGPVIAAALADAVRAAAASLRELYLEGNRIGPTGAEALGASLRSSRLEKLGLALNPIGPQGAVHLAAALKHNTALVSLDLAFCKIGDEGAVAVATALRSNTKLRDLRLEGNDIGTRGAAALADALRINPVALRSLNLRLNGLDEDAATDLLSAIRHAKSTPEAGGGLDRILVEYNHRLPVAGVELPIMPRLITQGTLDALAAAVAPADAAGDGH